MSSFLSTSTLKSLSPELLSVHSPPFVLEIAVTLLQQLALGLVGLREVLTYPPVKPVRIPLDHIPFLQCVNCTAQLGVVGKFAEGLLDPTVRVTVKAVTILAPEDCLLSLLSTWTLSY